MTARSLQSVLRRLADANPPAGDGELLRRFLAGDEDAFAELVRRHGRLVWGVCRHLTGSDTEADDAFQATFLVLFRNAAKVRDDGRLSAWLHGVAYKVCAKARQATRRRAARERATAASERAGPAVPDSAWDRALAAVHEEVAKLPETLRVPFVLCCIEGKGVTEAAGQLGWKLGTFSGRLTRAKDVLLAKLDARGLTLGVVVGLGVAAPPAPPPPRAVAVARAGFAVPSSVLQLSQGVIGMSLKSTKMLAAAVLLTCGLGLGLGQGWVATAEAQTGAPPKKTDPQEEVRRLQAELEAARRAAEDAARSAEAAKRAQDQLQRAAEQERLKAVEELYRVAREKAKPDAASAKTKKWEYDFVMVSEMGMTKFVALLQEREDRGWEYNGLTKYTVDGKLADIWVFRRPTKGATAATGDPKTALEFFNRRMTGEDEKRAEVRNALNRGLTLEDAAKITGIAKRADDAKVIEAKIAELQAQLADMKDKAKGGRPRAVFYAKDLPLKPSEMAELLSKLAKPKFKASQYSINSSDNGVAVEGDQEVIDWAAATVKKLADK